MPPVTRSRSIRPAGRRRVVFAVCGLLILGACSSTSKNSTVSAADAASTVASAYDLPADQQACLEKAFHDRPEATRPLTSDGTAADADLQALGEVEDGCVQVSTLADAIVNGAAAGFGSITPDQRTCLNDAITGMSPADRAMLLVGLTVPGSLSDAKITELGQVTNTFLDTCHLTLDTPATGVTPSTTDAGSAASTP
jgi:hypothetical protein